jgi:hypothetical protein
MRRNDELYNKANLFRGFEQRPLKEEILERRRVKPGFF